MRVSSLTRNHLVVGALVLSTTKVCITDTPNPYEMMTLTRQERYHYEKEYNRANRKLLCEVFYTLMFVILPWRLRRKKRGARLWERRGRHFERFRQHRLRRQRRREMCLSTSEKENIFDRCFMPILRKFAMILKKLCFCC